CPPPGPLLCRSAPVAHGRVVRPVEHDDLHGELPRGEEVRRGAVAARLLEAEGEEDGILGPGGEAALVEELEDALGEGKGGVGAGVEKQRESLAVGTRRCQAIEGTARGGAGVWGISAAE